MGIGLRTLLDKEIRRFLKVPGQTLAQPVITTALYFLVFGFALGGRVKEIEGVPYVRFILPGLVMLGIIQNAFLNSASSMFIMKIQGTIVDLLVAPLGARDLLLAFAMAATVRGLLIGGITWVVAAAFTGFDVAHPLWVAVFSILVALGFGLLGLITAIASEKFEQLNLVPTFIITPLTFLGGVFYSAQMLPEPWSAITRLNPIMYMVEGLRFGLLGVSHTSPWHGLAVTGSVVAITFVVAAWMLRTGYKLRS